MDGELSVNDLAQVVDRPSPLMSQHLAKLRLARLVTTRRDGTKVFYKLDNAHVRQLVEDAVFNAEHAGRGHPPAPPRRHRPQRAAPPHREGAVSSHEHTADVGWIDARLEGTVVTDVSSGSVCGGVDVGEGDGSQPSLGDDVQELGVGVGDGGVVGVADDDVLGLQPLPGEAE